MKNNHTISIALSSLSLKVQFTELHLSFSSFKIKLYEIYIHLFNHFVNPQLNCPFSSRFVSMLLVQLIMDHLKYYNPSLIFTRKDYCTINIIYPS